MAWDGVLALVVARLRGSRAAVNAGAGACVYAGTRRPLMLALALSLACSPCPEEGVAAGKVAPMAEALDTGAPVPDAGDTGDTGGFEDTAETDAKETGDTVALDTGARETGDTAPPVDPCAKPYGVLELGADGYTFSTAGTANLGLSGWGIVCAVSCDQGAGPAGWLTGWVSESESCSPEAALPLDVDGAAAFCVEARDAGAITAGTCEVVTSAGNLVALVRWWE